MSAIVMALLLLMVSMGFISSISAENQILYSTNFNNYPNGATPSGWWTRGPGNNVSVYNGQYTISCTDHQWKSLCPNPSWSVAMYTAQNFSDFTLTVKGTGLGQCNQYNITTFQYPPVLALIFRATPQTSGSNKYGSASINTYYAWMDISKLQIQKYIDGEPYQIGPTIDISMLKQQGIVSPNDTINVVANGKQQTWFNPYGTWYLTVQVSGHTISFYWKNHLEIQVTDPTFTAGYVGFGTYACNGAFNDFTVSGSSPSSSSSSSSSTMTMSASTSSTSTTTSTTASTTTTSTSSSSLCSISNTNPSIGSWAKISCSGFPPSSTTEAIIFNNSTNSNAAYLFPSDTSSSGTLSFYMKVTAAMAGTDTVFLYSPKTSNTALTSLTFNAGTVTTTTTSTSSSSVSSSSFTTTATTTASTSITSTSSTSATGSTSSSSSSGATWTISNNNPSIGSWVKVSGSGFPPSSTVEAVVYNNSTNSYAAYLYPGSTSSSGSLSFWMHITSAMAGSDTVFLYSPASAAAANYQSSLQFTTS